MLISQGTWLSRLQLSDQLFSKYNLPRHVRGISLFYVLVLIFLLLSFGCESKPPEHGTSIELNKWMQKHFVKKKEYFYKFANLFIDDEQIYELDVLKVSSEFSDYYPEMSEGRRKEILAWFDEAGYFIIRRIDDHVSFIEGSSHTHNKKENKDVFRKSFYVYFFDGVKNKDHICSSELKAYQAEYGECQIILDDNFVLYHYWETRSYEKN